MGYEYSKAVAEAVRSDITRHTTVGCQASCASNGDAITYMYQWMMDGVEDFGAQ